MNKTKRKQNKKNKKDRSRRRRISRKVVGAGCASCSSNLFAGNNIPDSTTAYSAKLLSGGGSVVLDPQPSFSGLDEKHYYAGNTFANDPNNSSINSRLIPQMPVLGGRKRKNKKYSRKNIKKGGGIGLHSAGVALTNNVYDRNYTTSSFMNDGSKTNLNWTPFSSVRSYLA